MEKIDQKRLRRRTAEDYEEVRVSQLEDQVGELMVKMDEVVDRLNEQAIKNMTLMKECAEYVGGGDPAPK